MMVRRVFGRQKRKQKKCWGRNTAKHARARALPHNAQSYTDTAGMFSVPSKKLWYLYKYPSTRNW